MNENQNEQNQLENTTQESKSTNSTFCPSCGSKISENSSFCSHCGAKLSPDDNGGLKTIKETKKRSSGIVAWIIAVIAVIALLCTIAVSTVANRDNKGSNSLDSVEANATTPETTTVSEETTAPVTTTSVEKTTTATTTTTKETTKATTTTAEATTTATTEAEPEIEVVAEYTLSDSIGWYTRHFYVIKNNSDETLKISTSSIAYSSSGEMLALADASFNALGPGCISVFYESFKTDADIDYYETTWNITTSSYKSVIQDLSYVQNDISDGAIFQVTNNGSYAADFVQGYALFFLNGELVDYETSYFTDDDFEIKSGATISKQITSYKDFDTIEFYLDGRR
ncbi:MAG: zinc-ribbon domain-containing protein [Oscillospiraceae bacterium]|nr:zinc-ribbon domain-containing protein [Oscillospiraceae bacterium]